MKSIASSTQHVPIPIRWVVTIAVIGTTALLSLMPGGAHVPSGRFIWIVDETPSLVQNLMHLVFYGVMAASLAWSLEDAMSFKRRWWIAFLFCTALGVFMEWCQIHVPGRFGTLLDVALNTMGVAISVIIASRTGRSRALNSA